MSGGMGTVYRAHDRLGDRLVALKLLHVDSTQPEAAAQDRFLREAELLAELDHVGIVRYIAHGRAPDGQVYLVMEWLEGEDLRQRLQRGALSLADAVTLLSRTVDALNVAHQRGILHRDLKPSNLFLVEGEIEKVKILDFGIARRLRTAQAMTQTGVLVGTPEYMAPEQARGQRELSPAVDIFALGCVLYECLAGQPPFAADHIAAVLVRILFEEPRAIETLRSDVPPDLAVLLHRMLAKDAGERIGDAGALGQALGRLERGGLSTQTPEVVAAVPARSASALRSQFAEHEQNLVGVVLAALHGDVESETVQQSLAVPAEVDLVHLGHSLHDFGVSLHTLASGALVATPQSADNAADLAVRMARAALCIKQAWPAAVVSMAMGRGAVHGQVAVGEVVDLAAQRLWSARQQIEQGAASAVYADALSAKLLSGRFVLSPCGSGVMILAEEKEADASRPLLGKPTPCVGRDAELRMLDMWLTSCIEERAARVMLVTAAPGVGKSRLRHEFLRSVEKRDEPVTVFSGGGDLTAAGTPYGILGQLLRRAAGLSGGEAPDAQRAQLSARLAAVLPAADVLRIAELVGELCNVRFADDGSGRLSSLREDPRLLQDHARGAFIEWITAECQRAPVMFVLDDLQWGDALSVGLMDELLRELSQEALYVLVLARPEARAVFPLLWQRHNPQELPLRPLTKKPCERLVRQVLGNAISASAVQRIVDQSAGNALFLEELIRAAAEGRTEERPDTVLAMLQARIGRFGSGPRRLVRAASLFGETLWRGGLLAVLGPSTEAPEMDQWLTELLDAEVIEKHSGSRLAYETEYGFRHALMRDAAYALLTDSDLLTGHLAAGQWLAQAGLQDAQVLAEHFLRGQDRERAAYWYRRSAEQALDRNDMQSVLSRAGQALELETQSEPLGQLHGLMAEALYWSVQLSEAQRHARTAIEKVRRGTPSWFHALSLCIGAAGQMGDNEEVERYLLLATAAEPIDGSDSAIDTKISCLARGAVQLPWAGRHQAANQAIAAMDVLWQSRVHHSAYLTGRVQQARAVQALHTGRDLERALRELEQGALKLGEAGDVREALVLRMRMGGLLETLGEYERAESTLAEIDAPAAALGLQLPRRIAGVLRARALINGGRRKEGRELLSETLPAVRSNRGMYATGLVDLAALEWLDGNHDAAMQAAEDALRAANADPILATALAASARILLYFGEIDVALQRVRQAAALLDAVICIYPVRRESLIRWVLAQALRAAGLEREATEHLRGARRWLDDLAGRIRSPQLRHNFLTQVAENVGLLQAAEER